MSVEQQVMAADRGFAAAVATARGVDRARVWAEWFAPEGRQLLPGQVIAGCAAVAALMTPFFADSASSLEWTPDQGGGDGDRGWTSGRYVSRTADGVSEGRYLTVWVKVDGAWKVDVDTGIPDPVAAD
ncbi:MAG: hypothetical protein GY838_01770 [bacterium]|nr:hypothetical protein [bacterium]